MEGKLQEKKVLSTKEIEAQTLLELPDRQLMQAGNVNVAVNVVIALLFVFLGR
jgi:hypothetical protein